jgi:type IV pilus assembly protein PilZ
MTESPDAKLPTPTGGEPLSENVGDDWREKRAEDRAQITLKVDYKRLNTFFADYTKNISKGGTFIRTTKPLDVGTEFLFVLSLPSSDEPLTLNGEVKWVVTEEQSDVDHPPGMGIKFRFDHEREREEVEAFVEKLMNDALGEHISQKLLAKKPI